MNEKHKRMNAHHNDCQSPYTVPGETGHLNPPVKNLCDVRPFVCFCHVHVI